MTASSNAFDFSNVHDHFTPVEPADPSWDPHVKRFTEFDQNSTVNKGDGFDRIFVGRTESVLPVAVSEPIKDTTAVVQNEELDPLGWPIQQTLQEQDDDNDSDEIINRPTKNSLDDDEDLLGDGMKRSESTGPLSVLDTLGKTLTNVLTLDGSNNKDQKIMSKEERIRMYETILPDEESSVESNNMDDDWDDDDAQVDYEEQECVEDVEVDVDTHMSIVEEDNSAVFKADFAMFEPSNSVAENLEVPLQKPKAESVPEKPSKKVPLIAPPSAEKLKKWGRR